MEYDDIVEAFATDTADQAFHEWILPGRSPRRYDFLDTHVLYAITEKRSVDTIAITYQKVRRGLFGERLDDLLRRPRGGWMFGHVEMNHETTVMSHDYECEQYLESGCWNSEKVDGHDVLPVIVKESPPRS